MSDKIFCGSAKQTQYSVKINVCLSDIPAEFITTGNNGKQYARLELKERKSVDQYGNTHSLSVDTWKPDGSHKPKGNNGDDGFGGSSSANNKDLPF